MALQVSEKNSSILNVLAAREKGTSEGKNGNLGFQDMLGQMNVQTGSGRQYKSADHIQKTPAAREHTGVKKSVRNNSENALQKRAGKIESDNVRASSRSKRMNIQNADDSQEISEEMEQQLEQASGKIKEKLLEFLGISEEQLNQMMEMMGMTYVDLMNPAIFMKAMIPLSGSENAMALLTDENLYAGCMDLQAMVGDVKEELLAQLCITEEQLDQILSAYQSKLEMPSTEEISALLQKNTDTMPQTALESTTDSANAQLNLENESAEQQSQIIAADELQEAVIGDKAVETPVDGNSEEIMGAALKTEDTLQKESTKTDGKTVIDGENQEGALTKQADAARGSQQKGFTDNGNHADSKGQRTEQPLPEQVVTNMTTTVNGFGEQIIRMQNTTVQAGEIIRQVVDQIRTNIKPDMSSIEMQLHPESLGKVGVHIAVKEGILTASFTAQNQAVKEVMEKQLIQLKESFQQQGLKVEAIEVSVESRAFEKGMSGQEQQAGQQQSQSRQRNEFHGSEEPLNESKKQETLEEQIHQEDGNSVNYKA